jgi:Putative beta-barrel porin 2
MSGSQISMLHKGSVLTRTFAHATACALFMMAWAPQSFAQVSYSGPQTPALIQGPQLPPLDVPINRLPARDPNAISVDGWLLYPSLKLYSLYSDNLFLAPQSPISAAGIGVTPSLAAVWSNGIHTTTLYGNIDRQTYPTDNDVNTLDGRAGFVQRYEAMRDLVFTVNGNYTHTTWTTSLQNSIQAPTAAPTTTVLPNGNTQLPNGTTISPTGQVVGQAGAVFGSGLPLLINPSNQYTGTFTVDKTFNRGILTLSGSVNRTDYDNQTLQPDTNSRTLSEHAAFWLGPMFYAYSNASVSTVVTQATPGSPSSTVATPLVAGGSTTSYQALGGLGTRQIGLFRGSAYFGHQGSEGGGATAGGDVYGGALSYYPTQNWTLIGTVDRTVNISSSPTSATNLALTLPGLTAEQVPLSTSTVVTSAALGSSYAITQQWLATCQLSYSRIEFIDSSRLDNSWVFDASLRYDIWRNMSLTWEYRYTTIQSNAPLISATSNFGIMSAIYRF